MVKLKERINHMATKEEFQTALTAIEAVRTEVAKAEKRIYVRTWPFLCAYMTAILAALHYLTQPQKIPPKSPLNQSKFPHLLHHLYRSNNPPSCRSSHSLRYNPPPYPVSFARPPLPMIR